MNKQQQIKSEIIKLKSNLNNVETIDENLLISELTIALQNQGVISFIFVYREEVSDSWLQCEYYSEKLRKYIIFEYEVGEIYSESDDGTLSALDDFSMALAQYEDEINVFESRISFK